MSSQPTYNEAVDDSHRDGHEPTWEIHGSDIACSLCGWSYRLDDCRGNQP